MLCAVIAEMGVLVCPDTGPGHIASALGVPVVSIFMVKSEIVPRWHPYGARHRVVTTDHWVCPKRCVKETCARFDCLEEFDPGEVVRAAREMVDA